MYAPRWFYGVSRWCVLPNLFIHILLNCLRAATKFNWSINNRAHRVCVHVGFMNMTRGEHSMLCHMNDDTTSVQCSVPKIDFTVSHFICLMKINKSQALRYLILSHSRCVNAVCSKMSPTLDNRATHSLRPTM